MGGGLFQPADWYGDDRLWSVAVAVALRWASAGPGHRMGRYGAVTALGDTGH